jgi:hypothetical protein
MNASIVRTLILSDLQRHRNLVLLSMLGGGLALVLLQIGGEIPTILGTVWFFMSLILLGSMLPGSNVVNERKKQVVPFLMSLPLSGADYAAAKFASTIGMFLISWLTMVAAVMSVILSRRSIPNGLIPIALILLTFTLVGFSVMLGVALAVESGGWNLAATIAVNSSYSFAWYAVIRNATIRGGMGSPVPIWSPEVLMFLGGEFAAIALILALTIFVQSRKRDFI